MQLLHLVFLNVSYKNIQQKKKKKKVSYKNNEISPFPVMFEIDVVKQFETK